MTSCETPKCAYDKKNTKCVKPNPYIQTLRVCKKQDVPLSECREFYHNNREKLARNACDLFHSKNNTTLLNIRNANKNKDQDQEQNQNQKDAGDNNKNKRILKFHKITSVLHKIPPEQCLEPSKMDIDVKEIDIKKAFGTKSNYAMAYLANVFYEKKTQKHEEGELVAIKIMPDNPANTKEIDILQKVQGMVLQYESIHFPLLYKVLECPTDFNKRINEMKLPKELRNQRYLMVINELAQGDLKMFLHQKNSTQNHHLMSNTIAQIFLSIAMFHQSLNMVHLDCHWGNFLYHEVEAGGYLHYKIGKKDIYIPNMGYVWVIWDYGFAQKIDKKKKNIYKDYYRVIHAFVNKKDLGWLPNNKKIHKDTVDQVLAIVNNIIAFRTQYKDKDIVEMTLRHLQHHENKKKIVKNSRIIYAGNIK